MTLTNGTIEGHSPVYRVHLPVVTTGVKARVNRSRRLTEENGGRNVPDSWNLTWEVMGLTARSDKSS